MTIEKDSNGFIRLSEEGRAQFHKISHTGWRAMGSGDILDPNSSLPSEGDHAFVTEYKFAFNYEEIEPHFDREFLAEVEAHMERGAQRYERGNWQKATDLARVFNAIIRHAVAAFKMNDHSENHEAAIVANTLMMWNIRRGRKDVV